MTKTLTAHEIMLEAIQAQSELDEAKGAGVAVSQHLLTLAQSMFKGKEFDIGKAPNARDELKGDASGFLGACLEQERWAKSNEAGALKVESIPRCWVQAKSNIVAAHKAGLQIKGFTTESSLRQAVQKAKLKESLHNKGTAGNKAGATTASEVTTDIDGILGVLQHVYTSLDDSGKDKLKADLIALHTQYTKLLKAVLPNKPEAPEDVDQALKEELQKVVNH